MSSDSSPLSVNTSPSTASPTTNESSASDVDELDQRSRQLTRLLRKNLRKSERRRNVINKVRNEAWILEDQVKLLGKQTEAARKSLAQGSFRKKVFLYGAATLTILTGIHLLTRA